MIQQKIKIQNKLGLHVRPAALLVQTTAKFNSNIFIIKNNQKVNAKSILGIMMLAAEYGSEIEFYIDGKDENEALQALSTLINDKFGED